MSNTSKSAYPFVFSALALACILILSMLVGSVFIPPAVLFALLFPPEGSISEVLAPFATILFTLRIPRTLLVALSGAALSGSGAAYQGLFRNPLADPYLIGVASGAGLGAVIAMSLRGIIPPTGLLAVPFMAFVTALLTVVLVYMLARVKQTLPTSSLILAGVVVSAFAINLTSFLMITSREEIRHSLVWLLGGGGMSGWEPVLAVLPYMAVGLGLLIFSGHSLNVLQFGDEQASQLGLRVEAARKLIIVAATLTTAAAVAFSGIIGFVGLIVPHMVRMVWGADYRRLIPLSILNGASLLVLADVFARIVLAPQEVPVGVITALGGAPFFLWILRRSKNQFEW